MPLLGINDVDPGQDLFDEQVLTGQEPDEATGHIDSGAGFGEICVEQPSERERRAHRAVRLANSPDAADTARGATTHGGLHE